VNDSLSVESAVTVAVIVNELNIVRVAMTGRQRHTIELAALESGLLVAD
jgi:hypothetical protein